MVRGSACAPMAHPGCMGAGKVTAGVGHEQFRRRLDQGVGWARKGYGWISVAAVHTELSAFFDPDQPPETP